MNIKLSRAATSASTKNKKAAVQSANVKSSKTPITFIAPSNESVITPVPLNKAHFLDAYSKGKWNLSEVPCPPCMENVGFMHPPDSYFESSRRKPVESYMNIINWNERGLFKKMIGQIRKQFEVTGVSISLIDKTRQLVKYQTLLDMSEIPRVASLDAHTILSQRYFLLLDASKDWRTARNPFVTGVPFIRFYCGVPLVTKKKDIVGALAIYDPFAKQEFSEANVQKLVLYAQDVMKLLDTPPEKLAGLNQHKTKVSDKQMQNMELADLALKFGRATSKGSLMTVFEKDGSGGPYSQNHSFRFTKLNKLEDDDQINNRLLWDKLFKIGSLKNAASCLTKTISLSYKIDFVYILEIRIAEPFQIDAEYFPNDNKIEAENFKYANKLVRRDNEENDFMTRIIGTYGSTHITLNFENLIHYKAFSSEFGIAYKNPKKNTIYNTGVIMPFYRHNSKLVRKNKINLNNNSNGKKVKKVDVYLRSGGFLIALFNESLDFKYDSQLISRVFNNTSILRKIYITA